MKESHGEGVATHTGPESCIGVRKGKGEALTGEQAGRACPVCREHVILSVLPSPAPSAFSGDRNNG